MKLEVHERLALLSLLPKEGDYAALKTIRRAREMISFTQEEKNFYELENKVIDGVSQVVWNSAKASEAIKDCPVDEFTTNVVRDALSALNKDKKLTEQYMSLYDKFIITYR